ncbi:MAG TPA: tetratricopeptide repeat-containing diguanylate cyclase [Kineosporiaceae bacterium]
MRSPAGGTPTAPAPAAAGEGACAHPAIGDGAPHEWSVHIARVIELRHADPASCVQFATAAVAAAHEHGAAAAELEMSYYLGFALHMLGRNGQSYTANEVALKLARGLGDATWEGRALMGHGTVFAAIGDYSTAIDYYEQSLKIHRALGDRAREAAVLNNLGEVYRAMGGFEVRAAELYRESRDLFGALGEPASIVVTNMALAELARYERLREADPDAASEALRAAYCTALQAVREADVSQERRMAVGARLVLADAEMALGRTGHARAHVQVAGELLARYADSQLEIDYRATLARLLRAGGRPGSAIQVLREALALCEEHARPLERLKVLRDLEGAQEAIGDLSGALHTMRELHRAALAMRDQETERRAHVVQAQLDVERARHIAEMERLRSARLEQQNVALSRLAREDDLTGLPNRRAWEALLVGRLQPWAGRGFVCALADLDHFKAVNDRYSHQVGDEVLRRLGALMGDCLRAGDLAARYGGEEFAILVDGADRAVAAEVCQRLRLAVQLHPWRLVHPDLTLTISIGATVALPSDSITSLLARADSLLYVAKTKGRNRVEMDAR